MIEDYLFWRKTTYKPSHLNFHHAKVSNKTFSADLMVLRQVLKKANQEGMDHRDPRFSQTDGDPSARGLVRQS